MNKYKFRTDKVNILYKVNIICFWIEVFSKFSKVRSSNIKVKSSKIYKYKNSGKIIFFKINIIISF